MAAEMAGAIHGAGFPNPSLGLAQHSWEVNSLRAKQLHFFSRSLILANGRQTRALWLGTA